MIHGVQRSTSAADAQDAPVAPARAEAQNLDRMRGPAIPKSTADFLEREQAVRTDLKQLLRLKFEAGYLTDPANRHGIAGARDQLTKVNLQIHQLSERVSEFVVRYPGVLDEDGLLRRSRDAHFSGKVAWSVEKARLQDDAATRQAETLAGRNFLQRGAGIVADAARHVPKFVESVETLIVGNAAQIAGGIASAAQLQNPLRGAVDTGAAVIEGQRQFLNEHIWGGSLFSSNEEFIQSSNLQLIAKLNPIGHLADATLSPILDTARLTYDESARGMMNLHGAKLSYDQFKAQQQTDPLLKWGDRLFSAAEIAAGSAVLLSSGGGTLQSQLVRMGRALGVAGGFAAAGAAAAELSAAGEISITRFLDSTLRGTADSSLFMAGVSQLGRAVAQAKFGAVLPATNAELQALRIANPEAFDRATKALDTAARVTGAVDFVDSQSDFADSLLNLGNIQNLRSLAGALLQLGVASGDAFDAKLAGADGAIPTASGSTQVTLKLGDRQISGQISADGSDLFVDDPKDVQTLYLHAAERQLITEGTAPDQARELAAARAETVLGFYNAENGTIVAPALSLNASPEQKTVWQSFLVHEYAHRRGLDETQSWQTQAEFLAQHGMELRFSGSAFAISPAADPALPSPQTIADFVHQRYSGSGNAQQVAKLFAALSNKEKSPTSSQLNAEQSLNLQAAIIADPERAMQMAQELNLSEAALAVHVNETAVRLLQQQKYLNNLASFIKSPTDLLAYAHTHRAGQDTGAQAKTERELAERRPREIDLEEAHPDADIFDDGNFGEYDEPPTDPQIRLWSLVNAETVRTDPRVQDVIVELAASQSFSSSQAGTETLRLVQDLNRLAPHAEQMVQDALNNANFEFAAGLASHFQVDLDFSANTELRSAAVHGFIEAYYTLGDAAALKQVTQFEHAASVLESRELQNFALRKLLPAKTRAATDEQQFVAQHLLAADAVRSDPQLGAVVAGLMLDSSQRGQSNIALTLQAKFQFPHSELTELTRSLQAQLPEALANDPQLANSILREFPRLASPANRGQMLQAATAGLTNYLQISGNSVSAATTAQELAERLEMPAQNWSAIATPVLVNFVQNYDARSPNIIEYADALKLPPELAARLAGNNIIQLLKTKPFTATELLHQLPRELNVASELNKPENLETLAAVVSIQPLLYNRLHREFPELQQTLEKIPWSETFKGLESVQAPAASDAHNPWLNELPALIQSGLLNVADPQDGAVLLDFARKYGIINTPVLLETHLELSLSESVDELEDETRENIEQTLRRDISDLTIAEIQKELSTFHRTVKDTLVSGDRKQVLGLAEAVSNPVAEDLVRSVLGASEFGSSTPPSEVISTLAQNIEQFPGRFVLPPEYTERTLSVPRMERRAQSAEEAQRLAAETHRVLTNPELARRWAALHEASSQMLELTGDADGKMEFDPQEFQSLYQAELEFLAEQLEAKHIQMNGQLQNDALKPAGRHAIEQQVAAYAKVIEQVSDWSRSRQPLSFERAINQLAAVPKNVVETQPTLLRIATLHALLSAPEGQARETVEALANLPTRETVRTVSQFLEGYIKPHYLHQDQNPGHTGHEPLSSESLTRLAQLWTVSNTQNNPVISAQARLQALERGQREHRGELAVTLVPSKLLGRVYSGDFADACFASAALELAEGEYPGMISYTLVTGRGTPDERIRGSVLAIETHTPTGETVLNIRGNNPQLNLLARVDADSLLRAEIDALIDLAKARGIDYVVAPMDRVSNSSSNRSEVADFYERNYLDAPRLALLNEPSTNFNGYANWDANGRHAVGVLYQAPGAGTGSLVTSAAPMHPRGNFEQIDAHDLPADEMQQQ